MSKKTKKRKLKARRNKLTGQFIVRSRHRKS